MDKKKSTSDIILNMLAILSFLGCAISYFFIEGQIGIHWNDQWQVDHYVAKEYIFLIGLSPILTILLFDILYKIDPRQKNLDISQKGRQMIRIIIVLMMIMMSWITVSTGFMKELQVKMIVPVGIGIFLVLLGNYLPTVKSNYFIGIKTPWALSSEQCWRKTNRFGGYLFTLYGLCVIITGVFQLKILNQFSIGLILIGSIVNVIYSYLVHKRLKTIG